MPVSRARRQMRQLRETGDVLNRAVFAAAQLIELEAARLITAGSVSGKNHVVSTPGSPPNSDTHFLDRSIETRLVAPLHARIFAEAPYAAHLEFGTSKMAARPFMRPAAAAKRDEAIEIVTAAVASAVAKLSIGGPRGN